MNVAAIATNGLGEHVIVRLISKTLLSKDELSENITGKINALMTARRPITLVDAIAELPPLLPPSADSIIGRRLYSVGEVISGSWDMHLGTPIPELLRFESELSVNTVFESSTASARRAAKQIPFDGKWLAKALDNIDRDSAMVVVETFADWSLARAIIFLTAKLLGFLVAGSDMPMQDTGFTRHYDESLDKTLWCIPFAFNPYFAPGKRSLRTLVNELPDYRSYQPLYSILTHREKIENSRVADAYAEMFGSISYGEKGAVFVLTAPVSSEKYIDLFSGWENLENRCYMLCVVSSGSQRSDAKHVVNALIDSVSNLRASNGLVNLGWETDMAARFSDHPVPSVKRNSLIAELLYRIVYRERQRIGICRSCGAPFLQSETGPLKDVCSQACRMTQRRRNGLS